MLLSPSVTGRGAIAPHSRQHSRQPPLRSRAATVASTAAAGRPAGRPAIAAAGLPSPLSPPRWRRLPRTGAAAAAAPAAAPAAGGEGGAFVGGVFTLRMCVRDYELDAYSVVNNAVYSSYLQHARHEAMAALGHSPDDFARAGTPLALSEVAIQFRGPLRSRDAFDVTVAVDRVSAARLQMSQSILRHAPGGGKEVRRGCPPPSRRRPGRPPPCT